MSAEQNAPVAADVVAPAPAAEAPEPVYFFLESAEGERVQVSAEATEQSKTISDLVVNLDYTSTDAADRPTIPLNNIKQATLVKIVEWCEKHKGEPVPEEDQNVPKQTVLPEWDQQFLEMSDDDLFDLVIAANYLDIKRLLTYACKRIAMMAVGKTPEELRAIFEIPTDEEDEKTARDAAAAGPSTSGPSTSGPSTSTQGQ